MNKISPNFTNTTVEGGPLGANLVSRANHFLENLPQYKGFRALPLMSNSAGRLEAMLLIPESQMKDLIIPPKLINRGITALNDRWHGRNTDELIFRSVQVTPNGDLGDKAELVTFPRKAFLTVLSNPRSLKLIEKTLLTDPRYSARNVFEAYKKVQVFSAAQENAQVNPAVVIVNDSTTEQEQELIQKTANLVLREKAVELKEEQLTRREEQLREREEQLREREGELAKGEEPFQLENKKLEQQILEQLNKEKIFTEKEAAVELKEKQLTEREKQLGEREKHITGRENKLEEQASQLEQERQRLTVLEQQIQKQLSMTPPVGGLTVSPVVLDLSVINPDVISPEVITNPQTIDTGRPNDNPDDADRQRLLNVGVSVEQASEHAAFATY
jgi:cytochrome c556